MNEKQQQRKWVREEVVILVVGYFKTKHLSSNELADARQKISDFLRRREEILTGAPVSDIFRNYAGISLQSARIQSLDPETHYSGMQGTRLQKEVVEEYLNNPEKVCEEAEQVYDKYKDRE